MKRINSKFLKIINEYGYFSKIFKNQKRISNYKKEVENVENIKQKNIIISNAVKQIIRENFPKKIFHSIVLIDKTIAKEIK